MKPEKKYLELTFTGGTKQLRRQAIECIAATYGIGVREFEVTAWGQILMDSYRVVPAKVHPKDRGK